MIRSVLQLRFWALTALVLLGASSAYGQASLSITKTGDTAGAPSVVAPVGQPIGFTIIVTNTGAGSASSVAMNDALPNPNGSLSGVSWSINATTGSPTCSISGSAPSQTLNCTEASLAPGTTFSVHVNSATTTASAAVYENCAAASASGVSTVQACTAISVIGACSLNYPYGTAPALSSIVFNESGDLVASAACNASGCGETVAGANDWIALFYTDEHAMTLGVRQVAVKTSSGTTTTNYAITPLSSNPGTANNPQVGTTMLGDNLFFPNSSGHNPQGLPNNQAGTDTATWSSSYFYLDSGRPLWPALFITDITGNPNGNSGDFQQAASGALPPSAIFGTWKGAVRTVDTTVSPYSVGVTPDSDPAQNNWNLGPGSDTPPGGFSQYQSQGWGTEVRWNVNQLTINGQPLSAGHSYRVQFMVHDGDQNKSGGDTGESCTNVVMSGTAGLTLFCPASSGFLNAPYSSQFIATGGTQPYSFSIISGALPPGLSLNVSTGAVTGTPTTAGTFSFTGQVQDAAGHTATVSCSITIVVPQPLVLQCVPGGPAGNGTVGQPYNQSLTVTGGVPPYTLSIIAGSLPPGLTLNGATGAITGTPTTAGNYSFTAKVVDSLGNTASVNCSIKITPPPPLNIACPPVNTGNVGQPYSSSLSATGGVPPYTFSISAGSLPPGLSLNPSTGLISGTPTTPGNYNFTAKVVDSENPAHNATVNCNINIGPPTPLTLQCPPATTGTVGQPYSSSLTASGGLAPYTFSITAGSLPPGLSLNPSTGAITGTPTTPGTYSFTAKVVDSETPSHNATVNCSITIAPPPPLTLQCPPATTGTVGQPYSSSLTATGGLAPYTFSISSGSLPPGLSLNPATGAITGTPTTPGTYNFTAKVVDSENPVHTATANCTITIAPPPLNLQCPPVTNGTVGQPYSSSLTATGGVPPYTFSIISGSLPPGLSLNASTGAITGTPTTPGSYSFTAKVVDSSNNSATANCSITIAAPPLSLQCPPATTGTVGQPYNSSFTATGGVPPYTFSIISGSLPPGLSLNTSAGAITGTPTTAGNYSFTAQVVDSSGSNATATCSINITQSVAACNPTSSLSVLLQGSIVTAYIPNGSWVAYPGTSGIQVVPLEPTGTPVAISTTDIVNSCASNSTSGQTVCTANGSDVYLISGSTVNTTLTSGSNFFFGEFSGGGCENCGVAINPLTNTAVIEMGLSPSPSNTGLQFLNLNNNTFSTPIPLFNEISEDVLWDTTRNLILSPNEDNNYDLLQVQGLSLTEFGNPIPDISGTGVLDSAGEDCGTGIALAPLEFNADLLLTDLTQTTFISGAPGSWSAPVNIQHIPEYEPYERSESGLDGIAVAPGTHLGLVIGEFPLPDPPNEANAVMAIQLPSNSGIGTPALQDYVVAVMPNDPQGNVFSVGCDPHTVAAYVSPNTGKALGLVTDYGLTNCYSGGTPQYVALIDLQGLLNAPRLPGVHTVDPSYDLVANGIVTFVATQ